MVLLILAFLNRFMKCIFKNINFKWMVILFTRSVDDNIVCQNQLSFFLLYTFYYFIQYNFSHKVVFISIITFKFLITHWGISFIIVVLYTLWKLLQVVFGCHFKMTNIEWKQIWTCTIFLHVHNNVEGTVNSWFYMEFGGTATADDWFCK